MSHRPRIIRSGLGLGLALLQTSTAFAWNLPPRAFVDGSIPRAARERAAYAQVVSRVAGMTDDPRATSLVNRTGLELLNVLWEDTGRWQGSSVGPNISDVTIEVRDGRRARRHAHRADAGASATPTSPTRPATSRSTADGSRSAIRPARTATLSARQPARFLAAPGQLHERCPTGDDQGRLAAGAARPARAGQRAGDLPADPASSGKATFWPVIFNYQSTPQEPGRADLAGDPPGHQRDRRRQRARHPRRAQLGPAALLQRRTASARR